MRRVNRLLASAIRTSLVQVENTVGWTLEVKVLQGLQSNVFHVGLHHLKVDGFVGLEPLCKVNLKIR